MLAFLFRYAAQSEYFLVLDVKSWNLEFSTTPFFYFGLRNIETILFKENIWCTSQENRGHRHDSIGHHRLRDAPYNLAAFFFKSLTRIRHVIARRASILFIPPSYIYKLAMLALHSSETVGFVNKLWVLQSLWTSQAIKSIMDCS